MAALRRPILALAAILVLEAVFAAPAPADVNPCSLLKTGEIEKTLGWKVEPGTIKNYHMPAGSGRLCSYEGNDGVVTINVPSGGNTFLGTNMFIDPGTFGSTKPLHGLGVPAEIYGGLVTFTKHKTAVLLKVIPKDYEPQEKTMLELARIAADHVP